MQLNIGVIACSWGLKVVTSDFKKFYVTISCHEGPNYPPYSIVYIYHFLPKTFSPRFPPSLLLLLISLRQTIQIPANNQLTFIFLITPFQISFPAKNATHANPPHTPIKRPKYPLPAPRNIINYSQNGQYTRHTANPSRTSVIVEKCSPLSSARHSKMASVNLIPNGFLIFVPGLCRQHNE